MDDKRCYKNFIALREKLCDNIFNEKDILWNGILTSYNRYSGKTYKKGESFGDKFGGEEESVFTEMKSIYPGFN